MEKRDTIFSTGSTSSSGMGPPGAGRQPQQPAQRAELLGLVVDQSGVLLEDLVALRPRGVLELEDRLGVEEVELALAPPLVLAADLELAVGPLGRARLVGLPVAGGDLGREHRKSDAADPARGAGEVLVDQRPVQADGLEHLGPRVGGHGRDAHLGHHLEHALAGRLDVVPAGLARRDALEKALRDHVVDGVQRQVRVDCRGAVADEQRHVVHLAGVARLDDQAHLGPGLLADQVVVHGRSEQQRGDGCPVDRRVAVREDDEVGAVRDGGRHLAAHAIDGTRQGLAPRRRRRARVPRLAHLEEPVDGERLEARRLAVLVDVHQLGQVVAVDHGQGQQDLAARALAGLEQVGLGPDGGRQRGHQLLTDGVEGRVGHLCEQLGEVVVQEPGAIREHRDRRVRAHGADGLPAGAGHGGDDDAQLLGRVAEQALLGDDASVLGGEHRAGRELLEADLVGRQPVRVGMLGRQLGLDLLVLDEATLRRVDEEHASGLQSALAHDALGRDVEDTHLAGQHDQPVVGHPVARRVAARCGRARRRRPSRR